MDKIPTRTKKNIQVIACILALSVFYLWLYSLYITPVKLKFIETESDICVAYSYAGSVCFENKHIDLNETKKSIESSNGLSEPVVYCISKGKVYFSSREDGDYMRWTLASVDLNGENFKEIICETFSEFNVEEYCDYYYNGKIIFGDNSKFIEYDVNSDEYRIADYTECSEYLEFISNIDSIVSTNCSSITIKTGHQEFYIDKEILAELSPAADKILEKYDRNRLSPSFRWQSTTSYFFDSIRVVDGEIYLLCRMIDFLGTSYALVFKLDIDENSAEYVGGYMTIDVLDPFNIVPVLN